MKRAERELIMRQQVVLPVTPRERRELEGLQEDLKTIPQKGRPLVLRLRNFRSSAEAYLASAGGPLPYMLRLREIERQTAAHEEALADRWRTLADESAGDPTAFENEWRRLARSWSFDEVNDLVERHNRWYPVESRLPMDPSTGDYTLVNGQDYRRQPLGESWVLDRFPAVLARAA